MNTQPANNVIKGIKEVIISNEQMQKKVAEMGRKISKDFEGKDLVVIGVLMGSIVFMVDLMRSITIPMTIDFISVSSYGEGSSSTGEVTLKKDTDKGVEGKDVLIVEDIMDTGLTLQYIKNMFAARKAKSVSLCTALDKPSRRDKNIGIKADYIGFEIPDEFVVGYGLDYAEQYRNLPDVCILNPEVYEKNS